MDDQCDLQRSGTDRYHKHRSVHYFIYTGRISSDDSTADQTAEILQIERCDAAGDPENTEEIQW